MNKLSDEWQNYINNRVSVDEKGCWNWKLSLHRDGYAKIKKGGFWQGHRLSFAAYYPEEYDKDLLVLHKCHNRKCVNPKHLYQGTHSDNNKDTIEAGKGRNQFQCGELHPNSKVDKFLVQHLRKEFAYGKPVRQIANEFGLPRTTVSAICHRHSWRHLI